MLTGYFMFLWVALPRNSIRLKNKTKQRNCLFQREHRKQQGQVYQSQHLNDTWLNPWKQKTGFRWWSTPAWKRPAVSLFQSLTNWFPDLETWPKVLQSLLITCQTHTYDIASRKWTVLAHNSSADICERTALLLHFICAYKQFCNLYNELYLYGG